MIRNYIIKIIFIMIGLCSAPALADTSYEFTYGGRLTDPTFKPVKGPVALKVTFYHDLNGQTPILAISDGLESVSLQQGIFQFALAIPATDYDKVFSDVGQGVWIQITDLTDRPNDPYPLQKLEISPYAAKVPVDGATVSFDSEGKLTVGPHSAPGANQFLTKDGGGNLVWGTPATSASALQGQAVSSAVPTTGQVLQYNGTQWLPSTFAGGGGTLTSIAATPPLAVTGSAASPSLLMTEATSVSSGYLSASDWVAFNSKQSALGFMPVNRAGDTLTGALNIGGQALTNLASPGGVTDAATKGYVDGTTLAASGSTALTGNWAVGGKDITAIGNVGISATKTLTLGVFTNATETTLTGAFDSSGAGSPDKGKTWFNSQTNQVRYWDGSTVQSLGVSGAGLTSLNGQSGGSQTFSVTQTGNSPAINSSLNVHTLSIPLANAGASVSAGLISNADYVAFSGKQASGSYLTALTGDVSATGPGSSVATLATTGVAAGTYVKVTVDTKGRVTAAATLAAADIPNLSAAQITSGTLATSVGGTGVNSTATFPTTGVVVTEAGSETLTNKTLTTPVISQISNTGVLTLPTSTDTLVGRDTADTLTNKTLTSPLITAATINGASTIGGSTVIGTTGTMSSGAHTVAGNVTIQGNGTTANKLILNDKGTTNFVALKAPDTLANSVTFTLPMGDGTGGQVLSTNGSGSLAWASGLAPTGVAGGDLTGSFPNPALATTGVTAGTYTKVSVDAKGRVLTATTLAAADIPALSASAIASGTFNAAQIPSLPASILGSGTINLAQMPGLPASQITSGSFSVAEIPSLPAAILTSGTLNIAQLPALSAGLITSGTLNVAQLPNLSTTYVALTGSTMSGVLTLPLNGLAAGTSQFVLANGNVGIGSASPAGKLDVAGTICLNGTNCISSWPGGGTTAVTAVTAGSGLIGGTITSTGSLSLATVGTAGSYAKVITDAYGRVTGSSSLVGSDLPAISATTQISGTLAVANGGTGVNTFASNGILVGAGSLPISTVSGSQYSVLTAGSGGAPAFGPVNLAQTAAVSGILPVANGGTGTTSGVANLLFATPNGSSGAPVLRALAAADLPTVGTAGTYAKVITDAYGRVTGSTTLVASDLPPLSASSITSGTLPLAAVPSLPASTITSGTFAVATIPNLPAGTITSGSFTVAQIPALPTSIITSGSFTVAQIPALPASIITSGSFTVGEIPSLPASILTSGTLNTAQLPAHSAALITSGTLTIANGGTGLTATPTNGQIPIGNSGGYTLATLTGGNGITVTNGSGSINIASTVTPATYVAVGGSTMTGVLNLPANGLIAGTNQLVLANGNVGIGTTAPTSPIEVRSTVSSASGLPYVASIMQTTNGAGTADNAMLRFFHSGTSYGREWRIGIGNSAMFGQPDTFGFYDATQSTPIMVMQSAQLGGQVGIGTISPQYPLHVYGTSGAAWAQGVAEFNSGSNDTFVRLNNTTAGGKAWALVSSGLSSSLGTGNFSIADVVANAPRLTVASGGNVGVGTSSPGEALAVAGNIMANNLHTYALTRTLSSTVNTETDIGNFAFSNGTALLMVDVVVNTGGYGVAKSYNLPLSYNATNNTWLLAMPTSDTGPYSGNDFALDIDISNYTTYLRLRPLSASQTGTAYIYIRQVGINTDVFTPSTASSAVSAPASNYTALPWITASLQNSWAYFNTPYSVHGYYRDSAGVVHLRGMMAGGTCYAAAFTLPVGYRPASLLLVTTQSSAGSTPVLSRLDVTTAGAVIPGGTGTSSNGGCGASWFSVDNVSFRAEQ